MAQNDRIDKIKKSAQENYKKLEEPKNSNLKDYVDYYVKEELTADLIYKTFPKKNISDPTNTSPLAIALNKYLKILPLGEHSSYVYLWNGIYKMLKKDGEKFTRRGYIPVLKRAEKPYIEILKARNQLAKKQSYSSSTKLLLAKTYEISTKDYQFFLKHKEKVVKLCQKQIPKIKLSSWFYSQFNNAPCFLCQLKTFPQIDFPDGVIDFVAKEYPVLKKIKHKVKIDINQGTYMEYLKKTDSFKISIDKALNNRHKVTSLIHELSHVVAILKDFGIQSQNKYQHELKATEIELKLLKKLDPKLYQEKIASMLVTFYQVSFEIEAYNNPDQSLPNLYANTIKHHLPQAKETKNYTYLINENFITHPLRNLPHAMAYVKLLNHS